MIRALEPGDLPDLVELCREHAAYERAPFADSDEREAGLAALFLARPEALDAPGAGARCWVVEEAGELVGFATANLELSTWDAGRYMHLDCLYLREGHRGRGLGLALMKQVARAALEAHAVELQWQTPSWNVDAVRFYRRLGASSKDKLRFTLDRAGCALLSERGPARGPAADPGGPSTVPPVSPDRAPAERWAPRAVVPLEVETLPDGWRVKPYALAWTPELEGEWERVWSGARGLIASELASVAALHATPRLAVVVLHRGEDSWWLLVDAWIHGGMLVHQIFSAPHGHEPRAEAWGRGPARSPSVCVWELAVLGFERDAYVEHVFGAAPGDEAALEGRRAYLEQRMTGSC